MSFITRITFTPSDIVFSNCPDLLTPIFACKGHSHPLVKCNLTEISQKGQPNGCITTESNVFKLIYPINEKMRAKAD